MVVCWHFTRNLLTKQGQFYMTKAQETDEQSSQKLLETRLVREPASFFFSFSTHVCCLQGLYLPQYSNLSCSSNKEIVTVDLHDLEPKDAVRLLKLQLTSLCGFSCRLLSLQAFINCFYTINDIDSFSSISYSISQNLSWDHCRRSQRSPEASGMNCFFFFFFFFFGADMFE